MHVLLCFTLVSCFTSLLAEEEAVFQTITFKMSARNLPSGKNSFAIANGVCKTETLGGQNPTWSKICDPLNLESNHTRVEFDIRNDIKWGFDQSIGKALIYAKNLLNVGKTISEEIWSGDNWRGTLFITTVSTRAYRIPAKNQTSIPVSDSNDTFI